MGKEILSVISFFRFVPRFTFFSAIGLAVLMVGAIFAELMAGQMFGAFIPAQWFFVLAIIAAVRYRIVFKK